MVWRVAGTSNRPRLRRAANINVGPYDVPANAPQPGGNPLDTLDGRLTQAVADRDPDAGDQLTIWTQHTVRGAGGRSEVRWYELQPRASSARQQGTVADPANFLFNGAVSPGTSGRDAVINYNASSTSLLPEIRARSRRGFTPLSTMENEVRIGGSDAADQDFTCNEAGRVCRWGDYAGASADPNNSTTVWGSNQVVGPARGPGEPHWRTRNFAVNAGG
jgi:hypothetical protein